MKLVAISAGMMFVIAVLSAPFTLKNKTSRKEVIKDELQILVMVKVIYT